MLLVVGCIWAQSTPFKPLPKPKVSITEVRTFDTLPVHLLVMDTTQILSGTWHQKGYEVVYDSTHMDSLVDEDGYGGDTIALVMTGYTVHYTYLDHHKKPFEYYYEVHCLSYLGDDDRYIMEQRERPKKKKRGN